MNTRLSSSNVGSFYIKCKDLLSLRTVVLFSVLYERSKDCHCLRRELLFLAGLQALCIVAAI